MIRCKDSVRFTCLRREIWTLFGFIEDIFASHGAAAIVTCGTEAHGPDDPHTHGFAIDLRSKHIAQNDTKHEIWQAMKDKFGPAYTVLFENEGKEQEHFHVQLKRGTWQQLL